MKSIFFTMGLVLVLTHTTWAQEIPAAVPAEETDEALPTDAAGEETETTDEAVAVDGPKYCPVCGPHAEMETLGFMYKHEGTKYRFCSLGCMKAFKGDPNQFLSAEGHEGHDHAADADEAK
jgi:YHS domain-containing protein